MNCFVQKFFACVLASSILLTPATSRADLSDLYGRLSAWWSAGSIGVHPMDGEDEISDPVPENEGESAEETEENDEAGDDEEIPEGDDGDADGDSDSESSGTPGMCLVPQEPPTTECDVGSGFLCVTTPAGGIAGESFVLTGTIDRQASTLASIQIVAQNEYTKGMSSVDTASPASGGCDAGFDGEFCLDAEGRYAARIELAEEGPYSIMVTASRLSGESVTKQVRTSRVIPTEFTSDDVSFNPDVKELSSIDSTHVTVTVDLLGDCQFCDFIGASTGGVAVTVENVIIDSDGVERRISCATTMEQGGQGRFVLGVPVGSGQNSLTIRACNAAAMNADCPTMSGVTFSATGVVDASEAVEFVSPEPLPSYDKDDWPTIPWKFKIAGQDRCVGVRLNREPPTEICPDANGLYSMNIRPRVGINVASITSETGADEFAWTFGWGEILSPHADGDGRIGIPSAVELGLTSHAAKDILLPALNNYLGSDEFEALLDDMLSDMGGGSSSSDEDEEILALIPKCKGGSGGEFTVELRGKPDLGDALLKSLTFEQDEMGLKLVLKDTEVGLDVIPKKDLPPLPIVIMIRKAVLDVELEVDTAADGGPRILVTSPHEDCDYKSGTYCKHIPAPLIPKNIVGDANSYGGFLKCNMSLAQGKAKEACSAINSLNAQTGVLSEVVLDALNEAIYCGGSAAMTGAARNGVDIPPITIGCEARGGCVSGIGTIIPLIRIPIGVILEDGLEISKKGILVRAGLSFGDGRTYANTPDEVQIESAGIIASEGLGEGSLSTPGGFGGDLNASVSLDAVNALLFTAIAQGDGRESFGALDVDVHEPFFNRLDFDFVKECDAYEIPEGGEDDRSTLCNIRPRVSELLGTALTTYGYLPGNHPLMMAIRGNRALGPRISVVEVDDLPVVVQDEEMAGEGVSQPTGSLLAIDIGGLRLDFYALEIDEAAGLDEYGNPALKLDANGNPIIMSMRPDNPDPRDGAIISFDLTLLLGAEVGMIEPDPEDPDSFRMSLGILGDRSRLVLTPMPGTNATTVPAAGLVSSLSEKLKYAIVALEEFDIPIPREIALEADDDGIFGMLGLSKIGFGDDGLSLDFDAESNRAELAVSAIIEQILHVNGDTKKYSLP